MKNKYRYILAFLILALVAAVFTWRYTFRKSDPSVASKKADVEMDASSLLQAFETDEKAANALYLGKIILVSGTVESVTNNSLEISVYLRESDAVAGIICSFDKSSTDIGSIGKGLTVRIKGVCTGYLLDVVMNKCSMETSLNK